MTKTFTDHILDRLDSIATSQRLTTMQIPRYPSMMCSTDPWSATGDFVAQARNNGWRTVGRLRYTFRDGDAQSSIDFSGPDALGNQTKTFLFWPWDDKVINSMFDYWRDLLKTALDRKEQVETTC